MTEAGPSRSRGEQQRAMRAIVRHTRRLVIAVIGGTVVLIGAALLVLPGPGLVVIAFGITILALEFAWARRLIEKGKIAVQRIKRRPETTDRRGDNKMTGQQHNNQETA